jgi:radical SAM superfamily enzyme YgiQ (UPF0313 family)
MKRPALLLFNPWILDFAAYDLWIRPLGLLVLATRLREMGWEPILVDCLGADLLDPAETRNLRQGRGKFPRQPVQKPEPLSSIPRLFCRYGAPVERVTDALKAAPEPAAVLVTSLMTYWYPGVRDGVALIRECFPDIPVLLGGGYATLLPRHAARACAPDRVVQGAGEYRIGRALHELTGFAGTGGPDAGSLAFHVAPDLLDRKPFLPLLTTRGCPYACTYCASRILAPAFVRRDPDDVVNTVFHAYQHLGLRDIVLYDDAFLFQPDVHALPIMEHLAQRCPGLRWHSPNGLHSSCIDAEVARAMKRTGFETIRLGFESSSDAFHSRTGGKTSRSDFLRAVRNLVDAGFSQDQIGAYILVGLPDQGRDAIEHDVELVLEAGAHPKLAEYSPIPGTALWDRAVAVSPYPLKDEPLFHNCSLLPAAGPEVRGEFLAGLRKHIRRTVSSRAMS